MGKCTFLTLSIILISIRLSAQTTLLQFGSSWKYLDNGSNQGTAWYSTTFVDDGWKSGLAKFGYGIRDATTIVSFGGKASNKYVTTYFRKSINIANIADFSSFSAKVKRDDGVIVYVNGSEVYRNNMPSGTITYTTFASATSGGDDGATPIPFTIPSSAFISGVNIIAVEIHQASAYSSDIAFDMEITGITTAPPTDQTPPTVSSINRHSPTTDTTEATTITFRTIFSEPVTGVDRSDFSLAVLSGSVTGVLGAEAVKAVGTDGTTYDVTATSINGNGVLRLDLKDSNTGIADAAGNGIRSGYANGQSYIIQQGLVDEAPPTVLTINRQSPTTSTTNATAVTFRVTFSEPVSGVDYSDFTIVVLSGTVVGNLAANAVTMLNADGATYDVTVSSITNSGTLRVDLKSSGTGIADAAGNAIKEGYTSGQSYTIEQKIPEAEGFASILRLDPIPVSTNTGEKPQSKVWTYDGRHWAVVPNSSGTHLWRLDGKTWTSVLKLSSRTTSKADCKMVDNVAHIFLYQGASSQMVSVEYIPSEGTYKLWSKRTSTVGITLDKGVETATIDMDTKGRMWLASAGVSDINVRWSDAPYNTWSAPVTVATGVSDDDICAVIALPKSKQIGILWSNQNTKRFGFKTHNDGASPSDWSTDEVPASQSALNVGNGMADDHMNMALGGDGTLYCAVKTSYDTNGYPEIALLIRRPNNTWDNLYEIAPLGTRPIVILNESDSKVRIVYTSGDSGGKILYRESLTSSISFSSQLTLMSGDTYNNSTSTKANFNTDVVILASSSTEAVGVLASDGTLHPAPNTPVLLSPATNATGVSIAPTLSWSNSSGATSYQVQVSSTANFSSSVIDDITTSTSIYVTGLAYNTDYFWRVKAINAEGSSSWSTAWNFKTSSAPTSSLIGHWKMEEGSGTTLLDASDYANQGQTVGNPTWVSGVDGQALMLNGTSQYATVPDNSSLDITGSITLAAWIRPEKVATQYILKKATQSSTNGYELSLSNAGKVFFRFNQASSSDTYRQNSVASYPTNGATWMHIAATYDGSVIKIYINGVLNSSKMLSAPPPMSANTLALAIGAQSDGSTKFQGAIDDARIYNTALSATQIMELATTSPAMSASISAASFALSPEKGVQDKLSVFPNPFQTQATINFSLASDGEYALMLYDSRGIRIAELKRGEANAGEKNQIIIDKEVLPLPAGLYIISLQTNLGIISEKLILSK